MTSQYEYLSNYLAFLYTNATKFIIRGNERVQKMTEQIDGIHIHEIMHRVDSSYKTKAVQAHMVQERIKRA